MRVNGVPGLGDCERVVIGSGNYHEVSYTRLAEQPVRIFAGFRLRLAAILRAIANAVEVGLPAST